MVEVEVEVTRESPEVTWSACQCLAKPMQEQTTFRPGNLPKWSYYILVIVAKGAVGGMITCDGVGVDLDQHFNNHHCKLQVGQLCRCLGLALQAHRGTQQGKKRWGVFYHL